MDITKETVLQAIANDFKLADVLTTDSLEKFAEYAVKGSEIDLKQAIRLLIDGYIDNCGISAGIRTIYYDAGQALFEKFIKTDNPLAARLKADGKEWFGECMEDFNELYTREEYGEFDITIVHHPEYLEMCMTECSYNIPEHQKEALCYGIYLMLNDEFLH